jgi:PKHD-type hydroxylase
MRYLHTCRDGLYVDFTRKIYDGKLYGLTHLGRDWYVFATPIETDLHKPTFEGYILKFQINENGDMIDPRIFVTGLDNGVHQIMIWRNHLYILETALQRILKVNLQKPSQKEYIYPLEKAISAWYKQNGYEGSFDKYEHMNSITVFDNKFYIMCPFLKNFIIDGVPSQNGNTKSLIKVFDQDWRHIETIETGRYYCHDLVVVERDLFFCDATNSICKYNTITKIVDVVHELDDPTKVKHRIILRGLSITKAGEIFVGSSSVDHIYKPYITNINDKSKIETPKAAACCIKAVDGSDYNDETSRADERDYSQLRIYFRPNENKTLLNVQQLGPIDLNIIDKLVEDARKLPLHFGGVGDSPEGAPPKIRKSRVAFLSKIDFGYMYDMLFRMIQTCNDQVYKFHLSGLNEQIQFTEYEESYQGHYSWHVDLGSEACTRKLSVVVQLSDPSEYEGCELQYRVGDQDIVVPKEKGTVIIFPSFLLHRVTPITKGTRRSLALWVNGPSFV